MIATFGSIRGAAWLREVTPGPGLLITFAVVLVFVGLSWLALRWLPGPGATPLEVLPGAALLAVGLQALHLVATLYLPSRIERASDTYGTLGTAIVLLLWLYLIGRLIMAGAVLNATMRDLGLTAPDEEPTPTTA